MYQKTPAGVLYFVLRYAVSAWDRVYENLHIMHVLVRQNAPAREKEWSVSGMNLGKKRGRYSVPSSLCCELF